MFTQSLSVAFARSLRYDYDSGLNNPIGPFAGIISCCVKYLFNELGATRMNRQGYTGEPGDESEAKNASSRPRLGKATDYLQFSAQLGPVSYSYAVSLYDGSNTGGLYLNSGMGLGLQFVSGEIADLSLDRAALTRGFIEGRGYSFGACGGMCVGTNSSIDTTTGSKASAIEFGIGVGLKVRGNLFPSAGPNIGVGQSRY